MKKTFGYYVWTDHALKNQKVTTKLDKPFMPLKAPMSQMRGATWIHRITSNPHYKTLVILAMANHICGIPHRNTPNVVTGLLKYLHGSSVVFFLVAIWLQLLKLIWNPYVWASRCILNKPRWLYITYLNHTLPTTWYLPWWHWVPPYYCSSI